AEPDWGHPNNAWKFHPISPNKNYHRFTHGMGVGDVNGDKRMDLLEKDGWWEQPKSPEGDPVWKFHPFAFSGKFHGGAQMYAYDVNGDNLNDIITSVAAHAFGLVWYEQVKTNDDITFIPHEILSTQQKCVPNKYGVSFCEIHAVDLIDMDGDGLKDIVTGKRFWSHGIPGDLDPSGGAVLYLFNRVRGPNHTAEFVPNLIDNDSGIGTQVVAA